MQKYVFPAGTGRSFAVGGVTGFAASDGAARASGDVAILKVHGRHGRVKDLESDRFYVVTEGDGTFYIDGDYFHVRPNDVIVIPPNTVYDFDGTMSLVMFCSPPYDPKNDVPSE